MKFEHVSDIDNLLARQSAAWPLLARGMEGLRSAQSREVLVNGYRVLVRHLPHRIASTTAKVDKASVAARPCFLCTANLPVEEEGISFNDELTIYCNPFPILPRHITIVHRDHRPQRIAGQAANLIALAEALPGFFVIYNGAECGASAPDHLHFQACASQGMPIVDDVRMAKGSSTIANYARHTQILRNPGAAELEAMIGNPEPMLNIAAFRDRDETIVVLFPRGKHRPAVFQSGEMTVSPATIDLCGVVVTPMEADFKRITGEDIRSIFEEVTRR